ncbi:glycosyltransferase [Pseudomonas cichorii]|nr:glycosyltransferase [Pseudomonas cichorii]MBX8539432.1 glycosyltransferase [Pseudomonas cichorii]MBX8547364.1 glycosyltransferase [Pseudomonas cichorii]MBX8561084.1 glycosyltransferase [Pseudomonas cichorii]MBX8564859.1 glycosyltransferase [Pseudomonas cichorii]MBX8579360.1 glycosyltransferase [Pseudomonas cichorii]
MNILMTTADHLMIDRRIFQEAQTLVEQGHHVTLLAGFECLQRESYMQNGIKIERFMFDWGDSRFSTLARRYNLTPGSKIYGWAWRLFRAWANRIASLNSFEQFILDRMTEYQVDVLHVHDFPMLAPAVELAKIRNVPLIYDAHELYYAQVQLDEETQKKYKEKESRLIRLVNAAITVNPYIANLMAERYEITAPHVIMNAAPKVPVVSTSLLRSRFGLDADARILLYQGWISDNRGIERIVEAAASFAENTYLVVVGYGAFEDTLKELVAQLGLEQRVFFYGGVPSDRLHELTCDADLGIIPYHGVDENNYFCSPNKLFEFAIAELPFISNDLPFLRDIAKTYGNGLLADLNSPASIASAVNGLFSAPEQLASLKAGALNARESINWDVEGEKLLNIYKSVTS